MFSSAANPYDEIVGESRPRLVETRGSVLTFSGKATDENLASEDWGLNIEVCDKVSGDGATGYVSLNSCSKIVKRDEF